MSICCVLASSLSHTVPALMGKKTWSCLHFNLHSSCLHAPLSARLGFFARILPSRPGQQITFQLTQLIEACAPIMAVPGSAVAAHGGSYQKSALASDGDIEKRF